MIRDRLVAGLGVLGVGAALGFVVRVALAGGMDGRSAWLAVVGAVLLVAFAVLDRGDDASTPRRRREVGGATGVVVAAAALALTTQALVRTVDRTWDWTSDRTHSLSEQGRAVVQGLAQPVELLAFFPRHSPHRRAFEALARAVEGAGGDVTVRWLDPLAQPLLAREYEVTTEAGEVVLVAGDRRDRLVGRFDEAALLDALVRVSSESDHLVCWITDHGEADPDDTRSPDGLGAVVTALDGRNVQVVRRGLLSGRVDADCEAVVVARPTVDWLPHEHAALVRWVRDGGRALVLLEPGQSTSLARGLSALGVVVGEDLVLDPDETHRPAGLEDASILGIPPAALGDHPITQGLPGTILLGLARSVDVPEALDGTLSRTLLHAGSDSWAEVDLDDGSAAFAPGAHERRGHVPLGAVIEVTDPGAVDLAPARGPVVEREDVAATVWRVLDLGLEQPPAERSDTLDLVDDLGLSAGAMRALTQALSGELGGLVSPRGTDVGALVDASLDVARARVFGATPQAEADGREPRAGGRLVVFGDAGFAGNRQVAFGSNRELVLNAIAWLLDETDQLGARPHGSAEVLDMSGGELRAMAVLAVLGAPGGIGLMALWVLLGRRRR